MKKQKSWWKKKENNSVVLKCSKWDAGSDQGYPRLQGVQVWQVFVGSVGHQGSKKFQVRQVTEVGCKTVAF